MKKIVFPDLGMFLLLLLVFVFFASASLCLLFFSH